MVQSPYKVQSTGSVVSKASQESNTIDIPVKVVNPINKCESKTYMLSLPLEKVTTPKYYANLLTCILKYCTQHV